MRATTLTGTNAFACNAQYYRVAANAQVTNSNDTCARMSAALSVKRCIVSACPWLIHIRVYTACNIANSNGLGISCTTTGTLAQASVANGFSCNAGFYLVDRPATGLTAGADTCARMSALDMQTHCGGSAHMDMRPAACTLANSNNKGVVCDARTGLTPRGDTSKGFLCNSGFFQVRVGTAPNLVTCAQCATCGPNSTTRTACSQTANTTCNCMPPLRLPPLMHAVPFFNACHHPLQCRAR